MSKPPRQPDRNRRTRAQTGAQDAPSGALSRQGAGSRSDRVRMDDRRVPAAEAPRRPRASRAKGLWLYGRHAVAAALANPRRSCHRLLATAEALTRLGGHAERAGVEVAVVHRPALERLLGAATVHQGLALSVAPLPELDLRRTCAPEPGRNVVLALDQINDPHNLGAILRSAAAFEVRAVVLPERRTAELGGVVAKAASGALDLVPVVEVVNLARALDQLAALGYWRLALDAGAAATLDEVPDEGNLVLVLGAEGSGLRRLVGERCDFAARLPVAPHMASLNVSVACGIALYALVRRRGAE
jgi:23S rRNA (guanosine2251-2'-O)-methyltransferase